MLTSLRRVMYRPAALALRTPARAVVLADLAHWAKRRADTRPADTAMFVELYAHLPEWRSLVLHRLRRAGGQAGYALAVALKRLYGDEPTLHLDCEDIGPGFYVEHGLSTIVSAERIGVNCVVGHGVTLGNDIRRGRPTLHNHVTVHANSMVIGPVTLEDGVVVGAMSFVNRDVPAHTTVVGAPARPLSKDRP